MMQHFSSYASAGLRRALVVITLVALSAAGAAAQRQGAQQPTTGSIKGRVRVQQGSAAGVSVVVRAGEREVARAETNKKGEFELTGLAPGSYGLTLRKPGLQVGRMENVEVRAGKTRSLNEGLYLPVDEGSLALLRGAVFDPAGRSLPNAKVELAEVLRGGGLRKIGSRVTNETGSFNFRLPPEAATYRVTVTADRLGTTTKDVEVDGAAVFRVAVTLPPSN
ncbi:MAG TPA: carboxypeptidase-like regulatory domain-containing protein [Pyrinomonadaceae bacterium]|nr:carboxypeptidase-like regulatory domain-containing protein [Pyrinomonadaceae bacterium]